MKAVYLTIYMYVVNSDYSIWNANNLLTSYLQVVTSDSKMADAFARDALEAHNNLRAHHHAPPMTLNPEITAIAQKWADKLAKEDTGLRHTKPDQRMYRGEAMGENIAMKFDSRVDDYKGKLGYVLTGKCFLYHWCFDQLHRETTDADHLCFLWC